MYSIYKITCRINGKQYIGVTNQRVAKRWYYHCYAAQRGSSSHLHRSIRKYGKEAFDVEAIFCGLTDRAVIEQHFIEVYGTYENGLNQTRGGEDFTDSAYQRELQLARVSSGSHPFVGGQMQRSVASRRWKDGTNPLIGANALRIAAGTHNLVVDNPQRRRKIDNLPHHNQKRPWHNTKVSGDSLMAWKRADELHEWWKQTRGGYASMAKAFGLQCSLQKMYYEYFLKGWDPLEDPDWMAWTGRTSDVQPSLG